MKKLSRDGKLNDDTMLDIMMEQKKPEGYSRENQSRAAPPQAVPEAPLTDFSRLCFFPVKRRGYKFSRAVPLPGGRGGGVGRYLAFP